LAIENFISGAYLATYQAPANAGNAGGAPTAVGLGLTEQGFNLKFTPRQEVINTSDQYGGAMLDGVSRCHDAAVQFDLMSYANAVNAAILWPFTSSPLVMWEPTNPAGRLYSNIAGQMVFVGQANTPSAAFDAAAVAGNIFGANRTLTAKYCILSPGSDISMLLDSRLRKIPMQFSMLPYKYTAGDGISRAVFGVAS